VRTGGLLGEPVVVRVPVVRLVVAGGLGDRGHPVATLAPKAAIELK